ncbi:MAG: NAD(P)/FAD-dependent oxidoreductase [Nanoarchaeota archaeon]|nr:NAD(P)/FAD-dependent oxidoreductase [Nanoarchaeota archaeon]
MDKKTAVIIGAGPAGLTAAYELLTKTDIKPVIYEMSNKIGGISKTVDFKGNKIDIGGHRFFSKSQRVMQWWQDILPLQGKPSKDDIILRRKIQFSTKINAPDPEKTDKVMLIRNRLSRIFFLGKFFDYPLSLNFNTFSNLDLFRIIKIGLSYIKIRLYPIKKEKSLEDFFINRFGKELYLLFFKDYTEKVWGIPCNKISPEWGAQRIKGLSITKAIFHGLNTPFSKNRSISQKNTETSLIQQFMYPKLGPGQLWDEVAGIIKRKGGKIYLKHKVIGLKYKNNKIVESRIKDQATGKVKTQKGDYFFSTMPVKDLIQGLGEQVPQEVQEVAKGLKYRDFITVGLLLKKLKIKNKTKIKTINNIIPDNWIYIQERKVNLARLQIFNNWSPYLLKDENKVLLGLEYICNKGDEIWSKTDKGLSQFAIAELSKIGFIEKDDVIDSIIIRMPKTYPAYFGTYDRFHIIRNFTDNFENLFLVGRNGMHRYNNSDHSMLTAMVAIDNIIKDVKSKENIWEVNTEETYNEET